MNAQDRTAAGRTPTSPATAPARDRITLRPRSRRQTLLATVASAALAAPLLSAPAMAIDATEMHLRREALAHARALEDAFLFLTEAVREGDLWSGDDPFGEVSADGVDWPHDWSLRGIRARYSGGVLAVYMRPGGLKGVGDNYRAVQIAPMLYVDAPSPAEQGLPLHWISGGVAEGAAGLPDLDLPTGLVDLLPLDLETVAYVGPAEILSTSGEVRPVVTTEERTQPCPAGMHGTGTRERRDTRQLVDDDGNPVGDPVVGDWERGARFCRGDYDRTSWERESCDMRVAGPGGPSVVQGVEVYEFQERITQDGPVRLPDTRRLLFSTCIDNPDRPDGPEIAANTRTETRNGSCPPGFTGASRQERIVKVSTVTFPGRDPVVRESPGAWKTVSDTCRSQPNRPSGDKQGGNDDSGTDRTTTTWYNDGRGGWTQDYREAEKNRGGDRSHTTSHDDHDPGSSLGGSHHSPNRDSNVYSPDPGLNGGRSESSDSDSGSDSGGCFLTTAIVERRGLEGDDGPTLTTLRGFRDRYMLATPERKTLVAEYYRIAPRINAAIPVDHPDWHFIGATVDAAVAAIGTANHQGAFDLYAGMVEQLRERWL